MVLGLGRAAGLELDSTKALDRFSVHSMSLSDGSRQSGKLRQNNVNVMQSKPTPKVRKATNLASQCEVSDVSCVLFLLLVRNILELTLQLAPCLIRWPGPQPKQ